MAIVMATSSSVSTPGVVSELMAEIRRLRDAHAAEAQRVRDRDAELQRRDDVIVALHDAHVAELQLRDEVIVAMHDANVAQHDAHSTTNYWVVIFAVNSAHDRHNAIEKWASLPLAQ